MPNTAWLVDASYDAGHVTLDLLGARDLEQIRWTDSFLPYYLTEQKEQGEPVKKLDLFTQTELTLHKVNCSRKPSKNIKAWELEIDPALSYVYDRRLRFGVLHYFNGSVWSPQVTLHDEGLSRFNEIFGEINEKDPLKYSLVRDAYSYASQPVPQVKPEKLGLSEGSEKDYYNAFLLSRISNLPLSRTYINYSVSECIRSMLNTYYRVNNILIPNSGELRLGDSRRHVTGALTIAPESGTYFNMHVLDFESLYPGCIDVFNLSYETIRCSHPECQRNQVPGLDYNVCMRRRGIYSALIGSLRDLRLRVFKPVTESHLPNADNRMRAAASAILKLFLVSCYGVTIRIHGLASPLLAEAITAYGRQVLQSTWDMAKTSGLKPKYGDTDSIFLDNPSEQDAREFIDSVRSRFNLQLAHDRVYSVCVLSSAKKAYFGILPNGKPEIKGLSITKSNSPQFFRQTFEKCLARLSEGRKSPADFELAKQNLPEIVKEAIQELRTGMIDLADLEYRVELRDDPEEKSGKTLPQAYQAAWLMSKVGNRASRGEVVGFVKVHPFKIEGRQFTVKPTTQATSREINVNDYIRNLVSSLSQSFEPMGIDLDQTEAKLSDFV